MRMKRIAIISFAVCILVPCVLRAQYDGPIRIELEAAKDQNDYHFAAAAENGVFVFYEGNATSSDSSRWIFVHYDTNLVKDYHFIITTPALTEFLSYSKTDHYLYFLFQKRYPKKDPCATLLLTVDLKSNQFNISELRDVRNRNLAQMTATDGQLVLYAPDSKQDSIYFYHCATNELLSLSDIFAYKFEFCTPDTANHRWLIGLTQAKSEPSNDFFLYEYNYATQKARIQTFPNKADSKGDNIYNSARAVALNADTTLLMGTYNSLTDRYSSNFHSGIYTLLLHDWQFGEPRYYNYANLKSGKENSASTKIPNLNLQLLVGGIAHNHDQFALITEAYYTEYVSSYDYPGADYRYYPSVYGSMNETRYFNGYKYLNAYVTTVNRNGELIWDHYFPYSNTSFMKLRHLLKLQFEGENALLYYMRNNLIVNTLINGYEVLEKISSLPIETNSDNDGVEYSSDTQIEPWYGNNYIASGYQYVKNRAKAGKTKRYVFFLNKLIYK